MGRLSEYSAAELFDAPLGYGAADATGVEFDSIGIAREFDDCYGRHSHMMAARPVDVAIMLPGSAIASTVIDIGYVGRHREQMDTEYRIIGVRPTVRILADSADAPIDYALTGR